MRKGMLKLERSMTVTFQEMYATVVSSKLTVYRNVVRGRTQSIIQD